MDARPLAGPIAAGSAVDLKRRRKSRGEDKDAAAASARMD